MKPVVCAAVLAFALVSAQAAWAFTIDDQGGNNSDGTPRFTDPDDAAMRPNAMSLSSPSVSSSRGSRSDLLDPTRDPARLPPIPEGARIGASRSGFGNNSRFGYDRVGRPVR